MRQILFLILILFSSITFAQTQELPKAYKFDEFVWSNDEDLKFRLDNFAIQLSNDDSSQGYIFEFARKNSNKRKNQLSNMSISYLTIRGINPQRISTAFGGYSAKGKVEFWVIPKGAELPKLTIMFDEFSNVAEKVWMAKLDKLFMEQKPDYLVYIVIFGPKKMTNNLAKKYLSYYPGSHTFVPRKAQITFGGVQKTLKTFIYLVPPDAEPPIPNAQN